MRAEEIASAAEARKLDHGKLCSALRDYAIPLLEELQERASGWRFLLKIALGAAIGAFKSYVRAVCGGP